MTAYPGDTNFTPIAPQIAAAHAWVVDKSDSVPLPAPTTALYVGADGDVTVQLAGVLGAADGSHPTLFAGVKAGTTLPISVTFVMAATVSTNVVAIW